MSEWAARLRAALSVGDMVSFDPAYLRKISSYTGNVASLKGEITEFRGERAVVRWSDSHSAEVPADHLVRSRQHER